MEPWWRMPPGISGWSRRRRDIIVVGAKHPATLTASGALIIFNQTTEFFSLSPEPVRTTP